MTLWPDNFLENGHSTPHQQEERQMAMFKQPKIRQASLIVFATTVILILPNLTHLVG
ncbi:hypothetical protein [Pseudomonas zhanjiangensis]|uniref:Uncharacterized protein n=1 Tax=Pseudomonas zhanjiangensis TaxID=3239015 RepID=A0ABV3YZF5_9PSED